MIHTLPESSKETLIHLLRFLHDSELPVPRLIQVFGNYLLRPTDSNVPGVTPDHTRIARVLTHLIQQAKYLAFDADAPTFTDSVEVEQQRNNMLPLKSEFHIEAEAMYDFDGDSRSEFILSFRQGDRFRIDEAHPQGWLEGQIIRTGQDGYLPAGFVSIFLC